MRQTIKGIVFVPVTYVSGVAGTPAEYYDVYSDWLGPWGYYFLLSENLPVQHVFTDLLTPLSDILVEVEAYADLDAADEYAAVYLNDQLQSTIFTGTSQYACSGKSTDHITIAKADWQSIVGAGDATIKLVATDYCDAYPPECGGAESQARIRVRYLTAEATPPTPGNGPTETRWRSYQQQYDGNGNYGYLWADMMWDPVRKHHVWQIICQPTEKKAYGGMTHSPKEAPVDGSAPGQVSSVVHLPYYYRPRLVRVTASGDCARE